MTDDDRQYFGKRASEERARADAATDPALRRIHSEFATHYERALKKRSVEKRELAAS